MNADFVSTLFDAAFSQAEDALRSLSDWRLLKEALEERRNHLASGHACQAAVLPQLVCHTVGGQWMPATPIAAAWILADLASDIFDDLQDQDGKDRAWNHCSPAEAMLVGLTCVFGAQFCLSQTEMDQRRLNLLHQEWASTGLLATRGQVEQSASIGMDAYLQQVMAKSGGIVATVAWAGGLAAGASPDELATIREYGLAVGVLVQIRDDYQDLLSTEVVGDLQRGAYTLPVHYALGRTEHPLHPRLVQLCNGAKKLSRGSAEEVLYIVHQMQALSFTLSMAYVYGHKALNALDRLSSMRDQHLRAYVVNVMESLQPPAEHGNGPQVDYEETYL